MLHKHTDKFNIIGTDRSAYLQPIVVASINQELVLEDPPASRDRN